MELRFSEIRVNFPWHDTFTNKLITQTSIAYEKASILFQIAVTHSAIAVSQSQSNPEGLKQAFYYFKTCAGMLTYINENFLCGPSTDLSQEVVKFLVNMIAGYVDEIEKRLKRLSLISRERGEVLKDLKEKICH